jgi:murein tripeptide amidase MpaA
MTPEVEARTPPMTAPLLAAALVFAVLVIVFAVAPRRLPDVRIKIEPVRERIGHSVEGRPLECLTFGNGSRAILFMASIHGSEGAGTPLLEKLAVWLESHPLPSSPTTENGLKLIVFPVANPDGLISRRRLNAGALT